MALCKSVFDIFILFCIPNRRNPLVHMSYQEGPVTCNNHNGPVTCHSKRDQSHVIWKGVSHVFFQNGPVTCHAKRNQSHVMKKRDQSHVMQKWTSHMSLHKDTSHAKRDQSHIILPICHTNRDQLDVIQIRTLTKQFHIKEDQRNVIPN